MIFNFYFYEVLSAFGHRSRVRRGLSAEDGPNGRYNRFFHSFVMEISSDNIEYVDSVINSVMAGVVGECEFGGNAWVIKLNNSTVHFESLDFEEANDGNSNVFPFKEFYLVFLAWKKFLMMPVDLSGKYAFFMPESDFEKIIDPILIKED